MKIAFVGMSHLGIVSSLSFAKKGHEVIGIDSNTKIVNSLNEGDFPIIEPGLIDTYLSARDKINFSDDFSQLNLCDIVYISLDVDTDNSGQSDLNSVEQLILMSIKNINVDAVLVILCQVPPGFSRRISKMTSNTVVYQVETLVFGQAIKRALNPERIIVGLGKQEEELRDTYVQLLEGFDCPILKMNFESAELCKISINVFLASSVTVANTISEICEGLGADWNSIKSALQLDSRIGSQSYLTPGLGISGGNIERDISTSLKLSNTFNTNSELLSAIKSNSFHRKLWPARKLREVLPDVARSKNYKIAVWGLAYKKDTHSTKNSPSLENIASLSQDYAIFVTDPIAALPVSYKSKASFSKDKFEIIQGADALLILTDWSEYCEVALEEVLSEMRDSIIIDPFGLFRKRVQREVKYFTLGTRI
jgi:UDPglucose 6-dehydrogenase